MDAVPLDVVPHGREFPCLCRSPRVTVGMTSADERNLHAHQMRCVRGTEPMVGESVRPTGEGSVGGNDDGVLLLPHGENLKTRLSAGGGPVPNIRARQCRADSRAHVLAALRENLLIDTDSAYPQGLGDADLNIGGAVSPNGWSCILEDAGSQARCLPARR